MDIRNVSQNETHFLVTIFKLFEIVEDTMEKTQEGTSNGSQPDHLEILESSQDEEDVYASLSDLERMLCKNLESAIFHYEHTLLFYFGMQGVLAALSEYETPGLLLKDDPDFFQGVEQPETSGLEELRDEVTFRRGLVQKLLVPQGQERVVEIEKQELLRVWKRRYKALVYGYDDVVEYLKTVGFQENPENIAFVHSLLDFSN